MNGTSYFNGQTTIYKDFRIKGNESTDDSTHLQFLASDNSQRAIITFNGNIDNAFKSNTHLKIATSYGDIRLLPANGNVNIGNGNCSLTWRTADDGGVTGGLESGIYFSTPGRESVVFANRYQHTGWIFANGIKPSNKTNWNALGVTPAVQIHHNALYINRPVRDADTSDYNLYVNGTSNLHGNNFLYGDLSAFYDDADQYLQYTAEGTVASHAAKISLYRIIASGKAGTAGTKVPGVQLDAATGMLHLQAAASDPSASAGARIKFTYWNAADSNGQPVYISHVINDSYRAPYGLKIWGSDGTAPGAWLEVEGNLYIGSASNANSDNNSALYIRGMSAIEGHDSWLRLNDNSSFTSGTYSPKLIRSDEALQVGSGGANFYANSSGNGYIQNTFGVHGTDTTKHFFVNGTSRFADDITMDSGSEILFSTNTQYLRWTTDTSNNNSTGRSWYGIGTYQNTSDSNNSWLNISNYLGINITTKGTAYLRHNNNVIATTGNQTGTVGSATRPIYSSGGVLVASSATVGSGVQLIYLASGNITASTSTVGSAINPIFMSAGRLSASTASIGSGVRGVYLSAGAITPMSYELRATVNSGTANRVSFYSGSNQISSANGLYTTGGNLGINATTTTVNSTNYILYVNGASYLNGDISRVGNIYPLANNSKNLGSSSLKWANIYATTFHGTATAANYTTQLLGVNSSNTPYEVGEGNLIRAVWDVKNDNRWYFKAGPYECRVDYANSATNADMLDGYHASTVYQAATYRISNYSATNDWLRIATIKIDGTELSMGGFTAIFSNRECLDSSSFILTVAIRRNSTTSVGCQAYITPIGPNAPRTILVRSNDGVNFYIYFQSALNSWTTYYNVTKIMTENNVTFECVGLPSANLIAGSVLNVTAVKGGSVDRATDADTVDGYHANAFVKKSGDTMTGSLINTSVRGGMWISGTHECTFFSSQATTASAGSYYQGHYGLKTPSGAWSLGILSGSNDLYFVYGTDANYNANSNSSNTTVRIASNGGLYGAVWNDYAEFRQSYEEQPGRVVYELGNDCLAKTIKRLQHFAGIISDTFGFAEGETNKAKTPLAVAGRVLAYPYQARNNYKPGDCVCAAPGGTVDIMTRDEIVMYPDRIVGTVSCVPDYEEWGTGNVKVDGRIWIKVR